ncbi:MAG: DUF6051 family protein [Spirochaetota bacterium]
MSTRSATIPYQTLYRELAARFDLTREQTDLADMGLPLSIRTFAFSSTREIHPAADFSRASSTFRALVSFFLENNPFSRRHFIRELESADRDVTENREFRYSIFLPQADALPPRDSRRAIVLLHGLNEKSWHKYLPWAARLAERSGRPVILFPIAFHMNRAPEAWSQPREMMGVAKERKRLFPELVANSFANAALSHRIQFAPHRFLTSGLETYFNVVDLVRDIHDGRHPLFERGTSVDLFGYSIGAALSELLLAANRDGLFSQSRAFLFCGGSILDQANPVSKAIIDAEAYRGVVGFLAEFARAPASALPLSDEQITTMSREIEIIRSTIFLDDRRDTREWIMGTVGPRIQALVMERDQVFHPEGMIASWKTADGSSLFEISVADPPFAYSHEQPLPPQAKEDEAVNRFFDEVMSRASEALG